MTQDATTRIEFEDNALSLLDRVPEHLFQSFQDTTCGSDPRRAITSDLMRGHVGEDKFGRTGPDGNTFVLGLQVEGKR